MHGANGVGAFPLFDAEELDIPCEEPTLEDYLPPEPWQCERRHGVVAGETLACLVGTG